MSSGVTLITITEMASYKSDGIDTYDNLHPRQLHRLEWNRGVWGMPGEVTQISLCCSVSERPCKGICQQRLLSGLVLLINIGQILGDVLWDLDFFGIKIKWLSVQKLHHVGVIAIQVCAGNWQNFSTATSTNSFLKGIIWRDNMSSRVSCHVEGWVHIHSCIC